MKLTPAMDEGPIYRQQTIALSGNEQKHELAEHLQTIGAQLLVDALPRIASGELKPRQQPQGDLGRRARQAVGPAMADPRFYRNQIEQHTPKNSKNQMES